MTKYGLVVAVDDGVATIEVNNNEICENCTKKKKIGACDSCKDKDESKSERYVAYNPVGACVGDKVEFNKSSGKNFLFTLVVFILPLVVAVLLYFVASNFTDDETTKNKVARIAFFVSMAFAAGYSYFSSKKRFDHTIVAIIQ